MPREVYRSGRLVPARARDIFLTDEEYQLLRGLAERFDRSHGELVGNLLRSADIRDRRTESENAAEERRVYRLRAGGES